MKLWPLLCMPTPQNNLDSDLWRETLKSSPSVSTISSPHEYIYLIRLHTDGSTSIDVLTMHSAIKV